MTDRLEYPEIDRLAYDHGDWMRDFSIPGGYASENILSKSRGRVGWGDFRPQPETCPESLQAYDAALSRAKPSLSRKEWRVYRGRYFGKVVDGSDGREWMQLSVPAIAWDIRVSSADVIAVLNRVHRVLSRELGRAA